MSPSFSIQELGIGLKARYCCASLLPQLPLVLLDVAFLAIQQLDPKPVALLANDLERDATRYGGHDCAVVIGLRTNGDAILSAPANLDRKSTRLNSSHGYISYAVFCLKKKNKD